MTTKFESTAKKGHWCAKKIFSKFCALWLTPHHGLFSLSFEQIDSIIVTMQVMQANKMEDRGAPQPSSLT
jgi:hypothetical protein